jgi:starch synthase
VSSELLPYSKTGGLADVAAALSAALAAMGHEVTLFTPRYTGIGVRRATRRRTSIPMGAETLEVTFPEEKTASGVRVVFVDCPRLFERDGLYGAGGVDFGDNALRFALLARAALIFAAERRLRVSVFHAHDWQGGLLPVYLRTLFAGHPAIGSAPVVFTIHNIAYQGVFGKDWMPRLDLDWRLFHVDGLELYDSVSFLKAGINYSERITTVSPRYAQELLTPELGFGFDGILGRRRSDLVGVLNGIDTADWGPGTDRHLPAPFDADHLEGKRAAKRVLLETFGLPSAGSDLDEPVVGMIARMVEQKGLDLIAQVAHELPGLGARFVVLGTGDPWYEQMWTTLAARHPDRIAARIGFDERLAHLIEGGADLFLMPSRFEPCGLNQMYSLRYGTLPLVRATGGLDDTVDNYDPLTGQGTGFKFWEYSAPALLSTLRWALATYRSSPDAWRRMQRAGMATDYSWAASARQYVRIYEDARAARGLPRTGPARRRSAATR